MKNVKMLHNTFTTLWKRVFCMLAAGSTLLTSLPVYALDFADATVAHGDITGQTQGLVTDIHQTSQAGIINWGQFNIGAQETVNFNQPNITAITLNRVVGGDLTAIAGALNANGNVWVVNNAGVFVQQGAQINVGGMFLAAAMSVEDSDFLAGKLKFSDKDGLGVVVNEGAITAGKVALLGGAVVNAGTLTAPNVALVAGKAIELDNNVAGGKISVTFDQSLFDSHVVENSGTITATDADGQGGHVALTGHHVGNFGAIHADGTTGKGGDVTLRAAGTTLVAPGSVTTANAGERGDGGNVWLLGNTLVAPNGSRVAARGGRVAGNGGFIETSGYENFIIETLPDVSAEQGAAGTWLIDPYNIEIVSGSAYTQSSDVHLNEWFRSVGAGNGDYTWDGIYVGDNNGGYVAVHDYHYNYYPIYNMNDNADAAGHQHGSEWFSTWSDFRDYWLYNNGGSSVNYSLKDLFSSGYGAKISAEYISQALSGGSTVRIMTGIAGSAGTDAGNISVNGGIANSSGTLELIAANDIYITSAITVNGLDLIAGGNVSQSSSGLITANTLGLNVTGNVILNQANAIQNVQGAVGGDLNVRTTTALGQGDALYVGLQTTLQSDGAMTLNNANNDFGGALSIVGAAGHDVVIQDQNDLILGNVAAVGDLSLTAVDNVIFTGTVAANAMTVRADASIAQVSGATITASRMDVGGVTGSAVQRVDLSAADNAIDTVSGTVSESLRVRNGNTALTMANAFTVSEDLVFTTGSDLTVQDALTASTGDIMLVAAGALIAQDDLVAGNGRMTITADGDVRLDGTVVAGLNVEVTAGGDLTAQGSLTSNAGDILLTAGSSLVAADYLFAGNGSVIVTAGDQVRLDGAVDADRNIVVTALGMDTGVGSGSALSINGTVYSNYGDISLIARGFDSSIYVRNSDTAQPTIYASAGNIVLDATGDIVADGSIRTYNHLLMTADHALTVNAVARAYYGNVTLTALYGDMTLGSGSAIIADGGNVALTTQDGGLIAGDNVLFYGGYGITLSTLGQNLSDGHVTLGDNVWMETFLYDIIINANGAVTIGTGSIHSGGDIAINAGRGLLGDLSVASDLIANRDVRLQASGSIAQSGSIIADENATGAGHTITLIADAGSITMAPAAQSQFGSLAQGSGSIIYQTGSVAANRAGGDITLGTLNAGLLGSVLVAADVAGVNGSGATIKSADISGGLLNIVAAEAELTASRSVGEAGNHLQIGVNALAARADGSTAADGIYVDEENGLTIKSVGSTDGLKAVNGVANIVVDVNKGTLGVKSGGSPAVQAGGNVRLSTLDQDNAGGSIMLARGANIGAGQNIEIIAAGTVGHSDITQAADLLAMEGSIFVSTANGSIEMDAQAVSITGAAQQNIAYRAREDIVVGRLVAGAAGVKDTLAADSKSVVANGTRGDVVLVAQQGSIEKAGAGSVITARDLRMEAGTGVGIGEQPIETAVDRVAASAGAGGVYISELDNLRVDQINPVAVNRVASDGSATAQSSGAALNGVTAVASAGASDGSIVVDAGDTVLVNQALRAANNLRVSAGAHDVRTVAALAAGDNATILAQRDVEQLAGNGDITANTGTIDVEAGRDILMSNGRAAETRAGDIRYVAGRDVQLGQVIANAGAADVYVEATAGEIRDAKGVAITTDASTGFATDSSRSSANVVANKLTMKATGNIGAINGGDANPIDTAVRFLTAKSTDGSIAVLEQDDVTLGMRQDAVNDAINGVAVNRVKSDGTAGLGDVTGTDVQGVTAKNNVTLENGVGASGALLVNARVTSEQGNVLLAAQGGTLTLNEQIVAADTAATKGAISILASGTIYQYSDAFVAGRLAAAQGSITAGNTIDVQSFGGSILMDDGTVSTTLRTDATADIRYVAKTDVQVGQLIAGKTVTTVHDPVTHIDSTVISGAADAYIRANDGAITDAKLNDAVTTDANTGFARVNPALRTSENVVARKLTTFSGTSTGSGINPLDTLVDYFSGSSRNGALHVIESDGVQIGTYIAQSSYGLDAFVNDLNAAQNDVAVSRVQTQDATVSSRTGADCVGVGTRHGDLTVEVLTGDLTVRSSVATDFGNILLAAQDGVIVLDAAVGSENGSINYSASVLASGDIYQHHNDARSSSINSADGLINGPAFLVNNGNIFIPGNVDVQSFGGSIYMDYANAGDGYRGEAVAVTLRDIRYKAAGDIWLANVSSLAGVGGKIAVDAGGSIYDAQGHARVRNLSNSGFDVMAGNANRSAWGARQDYVVYDRSGYAVNDAFNNDPAVAQRVNILASEVILNAGGTIGQVIDRGLTHGVNPLDAIDVAMQPLTAGGEAGNIAASARTVALFAQDAAGDMRLGPVQNLVINRVTTRDGVVGGGNVSIDDTVLTAVRASGDFTATMSSRNIAGLDTVLGHQTAPLYGYQDRILASDAAYLVANHNIIDANDACEVVIDAQNSEHLIKRSNVEAQSIVFTVGNIAGAADAGNTVNPLEVKVTGNTYTDQLFLNNSSQVDVDKINYALIETLDDLGTADPRVQGEHYPHAGGMEFSGGSIFVNSQFMGGDPLFIHSESAVLAPIGTVISRFTPNNAVWKGSFAFMTDELGETAQQMGVIVLPAVGSTEIQSTEFPMQIRSKQLQKGYSAGDAEEQKKKATPVPADRAAVLDVTTYDVASL